MISKGRLLELKDAARSTEKKGWSVRWVVPLQEGGEQPDPKDQESQETESVRRAVRP